MKKLIALFIGFCVLAFIVAINLSPTKKAYEYNPTKAKSSIPVVNIPSAPLTNYTGTIESAKAHSAGIKSYLKEKGFYRSNNRQRKVIVTNAMLQIEGYDYEEAEQEAKGITVFSYLYYTKGIAYQLGIRYRTDRLMELATFQILYQDTKSGAILLTEKII